MKGFKATPTCSGTISTDELATIAERLFNPSFKRPRIVAVPSPPSLSGSKLPPPCAEIDERPSWRLRRFRKWRDAVPSLYLAVLDPRRRVHLRRYQSYALPNVETLKRGVIAITVLLKPKPNPEDPVPLRPLVLPRTPFAHNPSAKIPKLIKNARWQRLLQYKYVLDQEHERRFRIGMRMLVQQVLDFERDHLSDPVGWDDSPWRYDTTIRTAKKMTRFFKDIRRKSTSVYHHLAVRDASLRPVCRREEVHKAVKAEDRLREQKQKRREDRRAAQEAAALAAATRTEANLDGIAVGPTSTVPTRRIRARGLVPSVFTAADTGTNPSGVDPRAYPVFPPASLDLEVGEVDSANGQSDMSHSTPGVAKEDKGNRRPRRRSTRRSHSPGDLTDSSTMSTPSVRTPSDRYIAPRPQMLIFRSEPDTSSSTMSQVAKPKLKHYATAPRPGVVPRDDAHGKQLRRVSARDAEPNRLASVAVHDHPHLPHSRRPRREQRPTSARQETPRLGTQPDATTTSNRQSSPDFILTKAPAPTAAPARREAGSQAMRQANPTAGDAALRLVLPLLATLAMTPSRQSARTRARSSINEEQTIAEIDEPDDADDDAILERERRRRARNRARRRRKRDEGENSPSSVQASRPAISPTTLAPGVGASAKHDGAVDLSATDTIAAVLEDTRTDGPSLLGGSSSVTTIPAWLESDQRVPRLFPASTVSWHDLDFDTLRSSDRPTLSSMDTDTTRPASPSIPFADLNLDDDTLAPFASTGQPTEDVFSVGSLSSYAFDAPSTGGTSRSLASEDGYQRCTEHEGGPSEADTRDAANPPRHRPADLSASS